MSSGISPSTVDPGPISAPAPTLESGPSVLRTPTRAFAPIETVPSLSSSPSIHQPFRSTSGSTEQSAPSSRKPVTGGNACRSTPRSTLAPNRRAKIRNRPALASESAPDSSTSRSAAHSRRWTRLPRPWTPGRTPRSSSRAPAAATATRPGGETKTTNPASRITNGNRGSQVHCQSHSAPASAIPSHTTQRIAPMHRRSPAMTTWNAPERIRTGRTLRFETVAGAAIASRCAARSASAGCSYTSATVISGNRSRSLATSWAASRLPPPRAKKSASASASAPRMSCHSSCSQPAVPGSRPLVGGPEATGQGRASRSIFPEVRTGRVSTTAIRGTFDAGSRDLSAASATTGSKPASTVT